MPQSKSTRIRNKSIDGAMGIVAVAGPLSAAPQIIQIFANQEARGVSLLSWIFYLILGLVSLSYGVIHKLKPIVISQTLWLFIDAFLIAGIIMYGSGKKPALSYSTLLLLNNLGKTLAITSIVIGAAGLLSYLVKKK